MNIWCKCIDFIEAKAATNHSLVINFFWDFLDAGCDFWHIRSSKNTEKNYLAANVVVNQNIIRPFRLVLEGRFHLNIKGPN